MQKFLSSKFTWLMLAVITVLGAVSIIQLQGTRSPAIAATNGDSDVEIREGVHYQLIDPPIDASLARVAGDSAGDRADNAASETITVTEFFWYGCPHCQYFEPLVEEWKSTFTDDLELEQIPVVWNDLTQLHASIYYLGRESKDPAALHLTLFDEVIGMRKERDPNAQLARLGDVLVANGVDSEAIQQNLNSPAIREKVSRANKLMRAAQVSSTPTLIVDYRWMILNEKETGEAGIFNVANHLIELARESRK
jgi:thiol:disulfide interchange protein DsbA